MDTRHITFFVNFCIDFFFFLPWRGGWGGAELKKQKKRGEWFFFSGFNVLDRFSAERERSGRGWKKKNTNQLLGSMRKTREMGFWSLMVKEIGQSGNFWSLCFKICEGDKQGG